MSKPKSVIEYIIGIGREFKTKINKQFDYFELTASQARVLGFITHNKEIVCSRDIEKHFDLTHPTVNGILKRLETKGMIRIEQNTRDKRVRNVYITEKSKLLDDSVQLLIKENERKITDVLTDEEHIILQMLLEKMYNKIMEE